MDDRQPTRFPTHGGGQRRDDLVPIGRFSALSRLSVRSLRLYDESRLLKPALVDDDSGYRYYSLSQLIDARMIRLMRQLEMPLDEIARVLAQDDAGAARARIAAYWRGQEERLVDARRIHAYLQHLLDPKEPPTSYEVRVKEVPTRPAISLSRRVSIKELAPFIVRSRGELAAYAETAGIGATGKAETVYRGPVNEETDSEVAVCLPIGRPIASRGEIQSGELAGGPVAYTMTDQDYPELLAAYDAVAIWVRQHGHEYAGDSREILLSDPERFTAGEILFEIQYPIK